MQLLSFMSKVFKLICGLYTKNPLDWTKGSKTWQFKQKFIIQHFLQIHVAQKNHMEMEEDSQHFMSMIHQKDMGMNPDDILNMNLQSILILLKLDTRAERN